jgi:quercetin dioxygenase-like cupin family protein
LKTILKTTLTLLCLMSGPLMAQEAKVTPLMSKDLAEFPGKEGLMIMVEYPPGSADPIHRHNAHAFLYVLEGSIVMQVKGGKQVTLTPGQTFYEGPNDVHIVGHNASNTKPAKFIVFLVKDYRVPGQRQGCACSDSGEVASTADPVLRIPSLPGSVTGGKC